MGVSDLVQPLVSDLDPMTLEGVLDQLRHALKEDLHLGDLTSRLTIPPDATARAIILAKEEGVLAGLPVALAVFDELSGRSGTRIHHQSCVQEGGHFLAGTVLAELEGSTQIILAGERTALNILQRLCGVATTTRRFVDAVQGTGVAIVDTRKTTPCWRQLEKYAVRCGGGHNHRFGLGDGILLKDNHIQACGGVASAVRRAKANAPHLLRVEVEVSSLEELEEALACGAEVIMLDNMTPNQVAQAVQRTGDRATVEVSGGITLDTVAQYAAGRPDLISVGALTHSAPAIDISLKLQA